jgi:hypothetical protein
MGLKCGGRRFWFVLEQCSSAPQLGREITVRVTLLGHAESARLRACAKGAPWKEWGPYLSEGQWGTVREDYSEDGNAWDYFSHDQARSRAYRWGEDGLAVQINDG